VNALKVAKAVWRLGAGRSKADEPIDYKVGIRLLHVQGEKVKAGDGLIEIHHSPVLTADIHQQLEDAIIISDNLEEMGHKLIIDIVRD
jgi:thymidine phosphorylase